MRIGEESYIIQDKINTFNLSLYIKKKLGLDKSSYNNSSFIFKEKNKNKSFTNINLNLDISTKIEANNEKIEKLKKKIKELKKEKEEKLGGNYTDDTTVRPFIDI